MADYTSSSDILDELGEGYPSSTDLPANVASLITAASRLIDGKVGRWDDFFYPSTDDVTRYFDGSNERVQHIDEFVSITSVAVAELGETASTGYTTRSSTEWFVEPYNYSDLGVPIQRLTVDINGSKVYWPAYRKSVQVVGVPGWSATPPKDIAQACKIQVARWIQRSKQHWQDSGANIQIGGLVVKAAPRLDADIAELLHKYVLELMPS